MPMILIRRPRSPRVLREIVRNEVRAEYHKISDEVITQLEKDVSDWEGQPEFRKRVEVGVVKKWLLRVSVNIDDKIGKIFKWVDGGTATYKLRDPYPIVPVNADALHFFTPNFPKTLPGPTFRSRPLTNLGNVVGSEQKEVFSQGVMHPGIRPRNFTLSLQERFKGKKSGSFHARTEAAIKRGLRKIGKH